MWTPGIVRTNPSAYTAGEGFFLRRAIPTIVPDGPFQVFRPIADELPMTLDELDKLLREARSPHELFGDDLDAVLRRFRAVCRPDRNPGDPRAERLYKELHVLAEQ